MATTAVDLTTLLSAATELRDDMAAAFTIADLPFDPCARLGTYPECVNACAAKLHELWKRESTRPAFSLLRDCNVSSYCEYVNALRTVFDDLRSSYQA